MSALQTPRQPKWRKITRDTCEDKWLFDLVTRPRSDRQERLEKARKYRKRMLLDNPGKTLAEILPELPPEMCERMETDTRLHWDEIEI